MFKILFFLMMLLITSHANSTGDKTKFDITTAKPVEPEVIEIWECKDIYDGWNQILVRATINGVITKSGV